MDFETQIKEFDYEIIYYTTLIETLDKLLNEKVN